MKFQVKLKLKFKIHYYLRRGRRAVFHTLSPPHNKGTSVSMPFAGCGIPQIHANILGQFLIHICLLFLWVFFV